jgi:glycosyltransferase involved in cell wall biosynthesis
MSVATMNATCPRVSLGLPVYNGETYLEGAIESLLTQTYEDFELIITDNASTDRTEEICRGFAERDPRVRYERNPENLGAAGNFNRAFELARGEFFKWAAHDDLNEATFLERCVDSLDASPEVVLSYPQACIIDNDGNRLEVYDPKLATESAAPEDRFRSLMRGHKCYEVFGLMRRDVLAQTIVMGAFAFSDGVLLTQLALRGRFEEIPEPLFLARQHENQSMALLDQAEAFVEYTYWFDSSKRGKRVFPHWRIAKEFMASVWNAPIGLGTKLRCSCMVLEWMKRFRGNLKREFITIFTGMPKRSTGDDT